MKQLLLAKFKRGPSFTFRGKFSSQPNLNDSQSKPSPNLYNPEKPMKNPAKIVFSKSTRKTYFDRNPDHSPGPGHYESSKLTERSTISARSDNKFQTCTSRFYSRMEEQPGPGAYEIKNDFKKTLPAFSIRKKTKTFHQIEVQRNSFKQDPGAYEIEPKLFRDSSMISIPKQSRVKQHKNDSPGPGRYDVNQKTFYSQRSFGKRSFSSQIRKIDFKLKNPSPGPIYNMQSSFDFNKRKQRGFSCRIKFTNQKEKKQDLPGPGQYQSQPNLRFRSVSSCKIPKAQRKTLSNQFSKLQQKLPGPGKYGDLTKSYQRLKFNSQSAPKFSKAKLESISSTIPKNTVVDNFYEPKINFVKKSSSSFSIGSSRRKQHFITKMKQNPGPGEYNPQEKLLKQGTLAPKFAQSSRHNPILNKLKVGPGQYFNEKSSSSLSKTGIKFSKEQRKTDFNSIQMKNKSALRLMNIISSHVGTGLKIIKK